MLNFQCLTLAEGSEASVSSCLGQQSCHRREPKTVPAQTAEITKCHVIFIVFFRFWIKNSGGDNFNRFLMDIPSFLCIICLCSWIRSYLCTTKKILVAVYSDCGHLSLISLLPIGWEELSLSDNNIFCFFLFLPFFYLAEKSNHWRKNCKITLSSFAITSKYYISTYLSIHIIFGSKHKRIILSTHEITLRTYWDAAACEKHFYIS